MTGIERLREYAEYRLLEDACGQSPKAFGKDCDDFRNCNECHGFVCGAIADQIEREIDEAVADEVADTLSAYEMNTNARWHSAVEEGAESDCKAEHELISRYWLPRPRFDDGEPVQFGDEILCSDGQTITVSAIEAKQSGWYSLRQFSRDALETIRPGELVKRPEPTDTWERIEADVEKFVCDYFGRAPFDCGDCDGGSDACPLSGITDDCEESMARDLVRRCKKLAGVE